MIFVAILTVLTFLMMIRSLFIVIGTYKDPVLASFEIYGEEKIFSPTVILFIWSAIFLYVFLLWYVSSSVVFAIGFIVFIPLSAFHGTWFQILEKHQNIFRRYPAWYDELVQMTDRDERRRIAYLWLYLPPATRMIYNVNNTLFKQWVEQVLLTVAR